jgi:hypothetical protein
MATIEFNNNKAVVNIQVAVSFTENDINDIMVGAIEGGINYWGFVSAATKKTKPQDVATSEWCARKLLDGETVVIVDIEDREERFELTLEKLQKGIQMNANLFDHHIVDEMDAEDYDRIIQYALFEDVVYG